MQNYIKKIAPTAALILALAGQNVFAKDEVKKAPVRQSPQAECSYNSLKVLDFKDAVVVSQLESCLSSNPSKEIDAKIRDQIKADQVSAKAKSFAIFNSGAKKCYHLGAGSIALQNVVDVTNPTRCLESLTQVPDFYGQLVAYNTSLAGNDCKTANDLKAKNVPMIEAVLKNPSAYEQTFSTTSLKGMLGEYNGSQKVLKTCLDLLALKEKKGIQNLPGKVPEKAKKPSDYSWSAGVGVALLSHDGMDSMATQGELSASYKNNTLEFMFGSSALGEDGSKTVPYSHSVAGPITFDTKVRTNESVQNFGFMYSRDHLYNTGFSAGIGFNVSMFDKKAYATETATMGGATTGKAEYEMKSQSGSSTSVSPILGAGYTSTNGYTLKVNGYLGNASGASVMVGKKFGSSK